MQLASPDCPQLSFPLKAFEFEVLGDELVSMQMNK